MRIRNLLGRKRGDTERIQQVIDDAAVTTNNVVEVPGGPMPREETVLQRRRRELAEDKFRRATTPRE